MDASEERDRLTSTKPLADEDCSSSDPLKHPSSNLGTFTSTAYASGSSPRRQVTVPYMSNSGNILGRDIAGVSFNPARPDDEAVRFLATSVEENHEDTEDIETQNNCAINDAESDDEESVTPSSHWVNKWKTAFTSNLVTSILLGFCVDHLACIFCLKRAAPRSRRVTGTKVVATVVLCILIAILFAELLPCIFASKQAPPAPISAPSVSSPAISSFYDACSNLSSVPNSDVNCTNGTFEGSNCTFTCNRNHEIQGAKTLSCVDSKWSNDLPSCVCPECSVGDYCEYSNEAGPVIEKARNNEQIMYGRFLIRCWSTYTTHSHDGDDVEIWSSSCTDVFTGTSAKCPPCEKNGLYSEERANREATRKLIRIMVAQGYYPYPCDPENLKSSCAVLFIVISCCLLLVFFVFLLLVVCFC